MDLDSKELVITVTGLRPADTNEQARFGFAPCAASELGLPAWWGDLALWIGTHQNMDIPLLVHERVVPRMFTSEQTVDLSGSLVSIPGQLSIDERSNRFFPAWFQVTDVNSSEMNRVWVEHLVMVHGGLRNGMVPVRFGISPSPLWVRATTPPPPPGTPANLRAKLMVNRFIRTGVEMQSLFLFGYLSPFGEELPQSGKKRRKQHSKK